MEETSEIEVCIKASELRSHIRKVDDHMKQLKKILNDNNIDHDHDHDHDQNRSLAISGMKELQKDQQHIKKTFREFLRTFFAVSSLSSPLLSSENMFELLTKLKAENHGLHFMKIEMENYKKQEDHLNERLKIFSTQFGLFETSTSATNLEESRGSTDPSSGETSEDQPVYETTSGSDDDDHLDQGLSHTYYRNTRTIRENYSKLLTKKMKLIKYYYLSKSWNQEYLSLLSVDADLRVNTMDEVLEKVQRLNYKGRRDIAEARIKGKRSFMELLATTPDDETWTNSTNDLLIKGLIREIGISLTHHIIDFMFVISENLEEYEKFKLLKYLLNLLMVNHGKFRPNVIKKMVYAIQVSEVSLTKSGKLKIHEMDHETNFEQLHDGDGFETEIDLILDLFLREALCLESMLSYPVLSKEFSRLIEELRSFSSDLIKCKKRIDMIGLKIVYLTTLHKFMFENELENFQMKDYARKMGHVIEYRWDQLEEPEDECT